MKTRFDVDMVTGRGVEGGGRRKRNPLILHTRQTGCHMVCVVHQTK